MTSVRVEIVHRIAGHGETTPLTDQQWDTFSAALAWARYKVRTLETAGFEVITVQVYRAPERTQGPDTVLEGSPLPAVPRDDDYTDAGMDSTLEDEDERTTVPGTA